MAHVEIFLKTALARIPYLLSLQDRNPFSPSYGSFDREYWQYKKVDTPYASLQSAVLSLALLYKNKLANNPYYNNKKILEWIIAGIRFLGRLQKNDGSFDEYYPNERSYIGTALAIYPCCEAYLLVKEEIKKEETEIIKIFEKSAHYLANNSEHKVLNQEAMSALAIYAVNSIFKNRRLENAVKKKLNFILSAQTNEGWFPEYGGCDIGYLSYTIDFLATYYKKSNDKTVLNPLNKAIEFISYFLHPNGTVGGEYTARNTEYLVPHGFQVMAQHNPLSNSIIEFMADSLVKKRDIVTLDRLDNRYLPIYTHQYIQAYLESNNYSAKFKRKPLPYQRSDFTKDFKEAGILVKKKGNFYIIVGTKKAGVIRVYNCKNASLLFSNCGYVAKNKSRLSCSSYLDNNRKILTNDDEILIEGFFCDIEWITPTVLKHIILRFLLFSGAVSKLIRELIKKRFITRLKLNNIRFLRRIELKKDTIIIKDEIISNNAIELSSIDKFSFRYIPSSRFFQKQELETDGTKLRGYNKNFRLTTEIELKNKDHFS